jgi:hypothetical protein
MPRAAWFILSSFALSSCGLTEPRWDLRRAEIEHSELETLEVTIPAVITAGQPATIGIRTYGDDGCTRHGQVTTVNVTSTTATIEPYDSVIVAAPDNWACLSIVSLFTHTAGVTFPQPGRATLRVIGLANGDVVTRDLAISVQ